MGRIIPLKFDYCFKCLFLNEKVRKYFISDALDIPLQEIRTVRLANTFLWKQYKKQKQGILDVVVELNNESRIDIELQIEMVKYWDKRSLFYAKTEEELNMLQTKTKNEGILEAISELKIMQMGRGVKALYDAHLKQRRDRYAREAYVRDEGIKQGLEQGEDRLNSLNLRLIADGRHGDLEKAAQDKAYRDQLYKEYHL